MFYLRFLALATLVLLTPARAPGPTDTTGRTDPNQGLFPDSSIVNFRDRLDAPAGKHGFLQVRNGKFAWPIGKRARFWGVNVSNRSVWVDKATIDNVVDVFARAGCNMVRFEALDSYGGLLDIPGSNTTRKLDPSKIAILDYWIARLRERGIYYYLDLLDFRHFKEGDEVPAFEQLGRAAKPYAVFDRRLIDLQKEFAEQLLTHRNPLTRLRYLDDPALALVEICNEHGLFMKSARLDQLAEPYATGLRQRWNEWLLRRHGTRDGIKLAWGRIQEEPVLADTEDPANYTVKLPLFSAVPGYLRQDTSVVDVRRAQTRLQDGVRFLYEVQRSYFREMREFLRSLGVRVPITGVVSNDIIPDVASAAAELDFTSENYYGDHPVFAGIDWQGDHFYNLVNPFRMSSPFQFAPWLGALRWGNKPVVVREVATVWPNRYRSAGMPEAAAYASLHDFDAVLLFGYQIAPKPEVLGDFDHQADPATWGLFALAGKAYLRGDIAPSPRTVTIDYPPDSLFRWPNQIGDLHRAAWFGRLNSREVAETATASRAHRAEPTTGGSIHLSRSTSLSHAVGQLTGAAGPKQPGPTLTALNGQIERKTAEGLLKVVSPRTLAIGGELPVNRALTLGPFSLTTPSAVGTFMAVSLDGLPLSKSRRFVVKMVTNAENSRQEIVPAPAGAPARFRVKEWGTPPIVTGGKPSTRPTVLQRQGKPILSLALMNGTWELVVDDRKATLHCDTAGIRGTLFGQKITANGRSAVTVLIKELDM